MDEDSFAKNFLSSEEEPQRNRQWTWDDSTEEQEIGGMRRLYSV